MPEIKLVPSTMWRQLVQDEFAAFASPGPERNLAASILASLHSRHVGISPKLAIALARIMLKPSLAVSGYPEPWRTVTSVLHKALYGSAGQNLDDESTPLRLNASMAYTVFRVVAPLVDMACERIEQALLFCEDDAVDNISQEEYRQYASALEQEIHYLAENYDSPRYELFWRERATALAHLTRARRLKWKTGETATTHIPAVEPQNFGLFSRLNPEVYFDKQRRQTRLQFHRSQLEDRRFPDAGADGVFVTRNISDLHRRLISELIYPELIRTDRLLNTGYLAIQRPPRPFQMRDALVVAIFPREVATSSTGVFYKTCWFEFAMRLSRLLHQSDLSQSELRWIEGDRFMRMRSQAMLLQNLGDLATNGPPGEIDMYRRHFLLKLSWHPRYLDAYGEFEEILDIESRDTEDWLRQAVRAQKDHVGWRTEPERKYRRSQAIDQLGPTAQREANLDLDQFAFVHFMVFLPLLQNEQGHPEGGHEALSIAKLRTLFRLQVRGHQNVSITWVSTQPNNLGWKFSGTGRTIRGQPSENDELVPGTAASELIETWLKYITWEMQRA